MFSGESLHQKPEKNIASSRLAGPGSPRMHENSKPAFSSSSSLKSIFEKLRFRDGLVWTVDLTVKIKLRFQTSRAQN